MAFSVLHQGQNLIEEVATLVTGNVISKDLSANLVVFPGKRPAHFLRRTIAARTKAPYLPPTILSLEEFVDRTYEQLTGVGSRKIDTIGAVAFLFEIHRTMEKPVGGTDFLDLDAFFPLGLRIYADIEELLIGDMDKSALPLTGTSGHSPPVRTGEILQSLGFFFDRFYKFLGESGYSSRSQRYNLISKQLSRQSAPWESMIFAGFSGLTACEELLFKKLLNWEGIRLVFQDGPGIQEQLHRLGIDWGAQDARADGVRPVIHFHKSPDAHGQVFVLSGLLEKQADSLHNPSDTLHGSTPAFERTAVVLPSADTLFAVLYHAIPVLKEEMYNISLGFPLERTPTWGFLDNLLQVIASMDGDRFYVPDYLSFVLHPYTKNIYFWGQPEITRVLFHTVEERLLADRTKSFFTLEEIEEDGLFLAGICSKVSSEEIDITPARMEEHLKTIHNEFIRKLTSFRDIDDFAGKIMSILTFVYDHSSARLHPFFHPFAESFLEHLDLLRKSRMGGLSFAEKHGYFHFLRRYIAHCLSPFEGTPLNGLQILGFLETRNIAFDRVYILDVNEGVIPDTSKESTLIPVQIRRALGLPTYKENEKSQAYYLRSLIECSKEVHIFYVENDKKEKSRFVERLLWERQVKEKETSGETYVLPLTYHLSLKPSQPKYVMKSPRVVEWLRGRVFDATSLNAYLKCPLRFYFRYVLGLSKREARETEIGRIDVGRLIHRILFDYFLNRQNSILTEDGLNLGEMDLLVDRLFAEFYGPGPTGAAFILKRQVVRQTRAFISQYMVPLVKSAPVRIVGLEKKIEISSKGVRFQGVLDRIDIRGNRTCIVDYKTGGVDRGLSIDFGKLDLRNRDSWSHAVGSLQLPLYRLLYEQDHTAPAEIDCIFLLVGKARINAEIELPLFDEKIDRFDAYESIRRVIFGLVDEIMDAGKPFDPCFRAEGACHYCDYTNTCGTQWQNR
jgi:ATP-dependent helicase/nuclease subunit B